jgi:uncharacterized membrane protein
MEAYLIDWVNLLLRWTHVIVAIAWVGSSFYFVFLDNSLEPPVDPVLKDKGVGGELWAVHGGGFYNPQKYKGAPPKLPEHLHWFYWESYATWLTGFGLFTVLYLWQAGTFLIDKSVYNWSPAAAGATSLGFLVAFWVIYDVICRIFTGKRNADVTIGLLVFVFVVIASWLACQLFAGRAAFLLVGAMIATSMSANVFFWIIPGQRKTIAEMKAGKPVDPIHGAIGKQRSVHNTYFTLPVIVAMLSNHYGFAFSHPYNWLVLVLLMLAGALIRQFFVARHKTSLQGKPAPRGYAVAGIVLIAGTAIWLAPAPVAAPPPGAAKPATPTFAEVQQVLTARCVLCHNAQLANKNVRLDNPDEIAKHTLQVQQQAVILKLMPMSNATQMTDAERVLLGRWFDAGAPTK